jgi:spore germination protein GerM
MLVVLALLGLPLFGCGLSTAASSTANLSTTTRSPTAALAASSSPILVYFSRSPESLNDPTAVFSVQRTSPTAAVATYAVQLLIAGPTQEERGAGHFSELNSLFTGPSTCSNGSNPTGGPDFTLTLNKKGSTTDQGTATLQFCRQTSSPGIGADARVTAEITKTLTQFSTITKVVILLRNGHCFGDESGLDRCLK